ncbi:unnamed protein product [Rhizophagus irregularis]|nr:unnamed protein product [Rhizophagus irregularis]
MLMLTKRKYLFRYFLKSISNGMRPSLAMKDSGGSIMQSRRQGLTKYTRRFESSYETYKRKREDFPRRQNYHHFRRAYTLMQVLNKIGNILSEGWNLYISNMADYNHSRDDTIDDDEILYFITLFLAKKNKSSYKKALLRTIISSTIRLQVSSRRWHFLTLINKSSTTNMFLILSRILNTIPTHSK